MTQTLFVSLFRHNTTIHNKKYFECLENHCHFKASRKLELLHHVVQKHRSRTLNPEIRKLNFEGRKKYFQCFVSPCKYQSEKRADIFRHVASCHPGTRVLSAGIKPRTTRTYWAQGVPNPKNIREKMPVSQNLRLVRFMTISTLAWPHFCHTQLHSPPNGDFFPRIWAS